VVAWHLLGPPRKLASQPLPAPPRRSAAHPLPLPLCRPLLRTAGTAHHTVLPPQCRWTVELGRHQIKPPGIKSSTGDVESSNHDPAWRAPRSVGTPPSTAARSPPPHGTDRLFHAASRYTRARVAPTPRRPELAPTYATPGRISPCPTARRSTRAAPSTQCGPSLCRDASSWVGENSRAWGSHRR
jgi:hypothetical protein